MIIIKRYFVGCARQLSRCRSAPRRRCRQKTRCVRRPNMATISEGAAVHTLIVMFTVEPSQQNTLVEHLRGMVAEHSKFEGFVSCSIHRSEDGTRVAEYIQCRS